MVVILAAFFRLLVARHVDAAAIVGGIAGDFAIGQVDAAVAILVVLAVGVQAAAVGFGRVAGDSGFGHVQRGQLARINAARRAAAGVVGDVTVGQVDRQAVAFVAADPQTASAAALVVSNFADVQVHLGKLLFALANRVQGAIQYNCAMLAAVAGDFAVVHGKQLFFHTESTALIIVGGFAGVVGNGAVIPGRTCQHTAKVLIIVRPGAVHGGQIDRRILAVRVILNGYPRKGGLGRLKDLIALVSAAADQADDAALALGVGKAGVAYFQVIANVGIEHRIVRPGRSDGVVIQFGIGNAGKVAEGISVIQINRIRRGYVVDDAAVVDPDLALARATADSADINSRSCAAVGRNVVIKQHIAHVFGCAAAHTQCSIAAAVVAVAGSVFDELGVVAAFRQGNALLIADGEQVAAHVHATAAVIGLVFLKQVARAKGQGALFVIHSAAVSRGSAVVGEGAVIQQGRYRNGRGVYVQSTAAAVGLVILKGVVFQHGIVAAVGFGFGCGLFDICARHKVDRTANGTCRIAFKGVAAQGNSMASQPHSTAVIRFALVVGKGAVCDGGFARGVVHEDSTRMAIACYTVVGKGTVIYFQCANAAVADGRAAGVDRCMAAERAALSHQVDIPARIDAASSAGQGHALQLYGGVIGFVGLIFDVEQSTAGGGQRAAVTGFVVVGLGVVIRQGKGQAHIIQVVYRDMAGEGVAVQVQGGAVLGVVDGHILGLVAQQVDGGVSFCILGIRCFHGLDGLVDAEILITANTGGVTAGVLPRWGQGVDGLGRSSLTAHRFAGGRIVFQPDEIFGTHDVLSVQGFGIGQVDRTALGKQHIARDGTAVEQGLFTHGQGAAGSAQIQVAGQLAGGVIPDDAAYVRALGGREGDIALVGDINCTAVIGRIVMDFAADHG